jgi:integrase
MANLFHPSYMQTDPKTGEKTLRRLRKWYGKYRDANGVLQRVPLSTNKDAAQAMLAELIRKAERQHAGLIDAAADQLARPVAEHVREYREHLLAKARSDKHISETIRIVSTIVSACRCNVLADLQGATTPLEEYLAQRRASGSSHRTINADLTAIRAFCRWLLARKRMHDDPTAELTKLNEDVDRRRERRPLSDEEAQKLIETTYASSTVFRGLTGPDRALLYMLAQRTGLRRGELLSLTVRAFDLASDPPTVAVKARSSKRRRKELLPLSKETARSLATYLADRDPETPVWPGPWWEKSAEMLRQDLLAAGIEPLDAEGRVVDFHGQRMTFITGLARAGVAPATAQKLARHSDINLTLGTYTRLGIDDLATAVANLPELRTAAQPTDTPATTADGPAVPSADIAPPPGHADLARLNASWPNLPEPIRKAIIALLTVAEPNSPAP